MSIPVVFTTPGNLAMGYCWTGPQQYLDDIVPLLNANISGMQIIISASAPGPADQDKLWARLVGGYLEGIYSFLGGWYRPNPVPASGSARQIWVNTEANLWAYDGGDGTDPGSVAPTATTGAMWQVDSAFNFRIPIGPGTNQTTYEGVATTIAQGGTGGAEKIALADKETPYHDHNLAFGSPPAVGATMVTDDLGTGTDGQWGYTGAANIYKQNKFHTFGGDAVDAHTWAHSNMPPYIGVFFIKRTVRQMYVAT